MARASTRSPSRPRAWVEYSLEGGRYAVLAKGALCSSFHMQARANDCVFTKR